MPPSTRASGRTRKTASRKKAGQPAYVAGKVRKAFWLNQKLLDEARDILGATTERQTVEMALDVVVIAADHDLLRGARALRRVVLARRS